MRVPAEFANHPMKFPEGMEYRAVCRHIVDGDTCDVLVDQGFNQYRYLTVRIRDIDSPEVNRGTEEQRTRGRAAREYLRSLIENRPVKLVTSRDPESFGRYVADIEFPDANGLWGDVASAMVDAGHAVWVDQ